MWLCDWETSPPCFATGLACRCAGGARPQGTGVCCAWSVGSRLPNLGVLGKAECLTLDLTHPRISALPLQQMKWIHIVLADPGQQVEQMASLTSYWGGFGFCSAGNQRSQASPTRDTTAPPKEKATTVSFHHFMSMQPPVFTGDGSLDKAEEWIEEIERIFEVLEVPGGNKVNFGSYMLKGDAKRWWKSTREIQFVDQQTISWRQFRDSFFSTYFPVQARNKKMREFLDLQQNHLSLEEYVAKYRHLKAYCPHLYTTAEARADKFIYGLRDGLRGRVMSSSPHNLDETVTMARHMEEDWARTQRDHQRKTSQHT
ncbi:hypothetical protein EJ110_NYTH22551 [Nymphaea thermarum]|nr:hypothetical protein EJ110_NYTH22551 [Nymphaea thermarum]